MESDAKNKIGPQRSLKVLFVTNEWPFESQPFRAPFVKVLCDAISDSNVELTVFPVALKRNPLNVLKARLRVAKLYKSNGYNHIHSFGINALFMIPSNLHHITSCSVIGSDAFGEVGKVPKYTKIGKIALWSYKNKLRNLAGIRPVSAAVFAKIESYLYENQQVEIFPNGINTSLFPAMSRIDARLGLGKDLEKKLIFFPSNKNLGVKNYPLARKIFDEVKQAYSKDIELLFPPMGRQHLMNQYYRAADVTLLTSLHEGSPNVVKESLCCGTPVFSTDVGDVKKHVLCTKMGTVFSDNENLKSISYKLLGLIDEPISEVTKGEAQEYCKKELSAEVAAKRMISFWNKVADVG
ncbi:MAG: glycosyltransferase family 4 protein [Bacteroidia bacterium]